MPMYKERAHYSILRELNKVHAVHQQITDLTARHAATDNFQQSAGTCRIYIQGKIMTHVAPAPPQQPLYYGSERATDHIRKTPIC